MKLNIGDRIKYRDSIYDVVATIFSTVYLRENKDGNGSYLYAIEEVYKNYKDIEIIK